MAALPPLCKLDDVKTWLGITDTSSDELLNRLITATSLEFANEIRRPDFAPRNAWIDRIVGNGMPDLYLNHYPIMSIASVTINGETQDESDGTTSGWYFDNTLPPEDRQKLTMVGSCWPLVCSSSSYPALPNIIVNYDAGYEADAIPADVSQAIIEWIGWKRGYSQLQAQNQASVSWMQLGQYQQSITAGTSTLNASGIVMPESVSQVIQRYARSSI
jgi:hypothetical protein